MVATISAQQLSAGGGDELETQNLLQLGKGPMNMAFHPEGSIPLTANHDAGSLAVVDLERGEVLRTVPAGVGVETLSFC